MVVSTTVVKKEERRVDTTDTKFVKRFAQMYPLSNLILLDMGFIVSYFFFGTNLVCTRVRLLVFLLS